MQNLKYILRILLILLIVAYQSLAQSLTRPEQAKSAISNIDAIEIGRPYFRVFSDKDGLPQNSVQAILVDKKNYLWVATQDGAAYYNGHRWIVVNMPNQKASNYIRAMYASSDGSMWFGTYAGVWRLKDKEWSSFNTANSGLPSNIIHTFSETEQNGKKLFWVGTNNGLASLDLESAKWTVYDKKSGLPDNRARVLSKVETKNGFKLWLGTDSGFGYFQNGKWQTVTIDALGEKGSTLPVRCFLDTKINGKQRFYVGTDGEGLACLESGTWTIYNSKNSLPNDHIFDIVKTTCLDGTERLWIASYGGGLACLESGLWTIYDTKMGLPNNVISTLFETKSYDGSHRLWIGTNGGGVSRLEDDQWLTYDNKMGLSDNTIMSLLETVNPDKSAAIWFGTYGGGLVRLDKGKWDTFNKLNGLADNSILALLETTDKDGKKIIWVATEGSGLAFLKDGKWSTLTKESGLPSNAIRTLMETTETDGSHSLWVGTTNGVAELRNDKWTTFNSSNGIPENVIVTMTSTKALDGSPVIWVGTAGGGLARYEHGKWSSIKMSDGLPSDTIYSLLPVSKGAKQFLWVGTTGGVCRLTFNGEKLEWLFFSDATNPALPNNIINQIREDARGRIYLFTNKGIARLTPLTAEANAISQYSVYTFTTENGLPSNEFNVGASIVDHKGRIWAGTVAGAAVFDPAKDSEDLSTKPFYIERMLVNSKESSLLKESKESKESKEINLAHNENSLTFEYALLSYFRESDTRYRTQLVGLDSSPSDWTTDYKKEYTTLPPGNYTFKVWAKDYRGNISGPQEIAFYIKTSPWRSWLAYGIYTILLGLLVYLVVQLRLKRLEQRNEMLTALYQKEQEVSRTLQSLNKMKTDFMLVTSHEMRTPLTVLKGYLDSLVELNPANLTASQSRMVKTCHRVTDRLINGVNDIQDMLRIEERRVALKAELVNLRELVEEVVSEVESFIEQRRQKLTLNISDELPILVADYEKLRLVLLNLIQNAIKFTHDDGEIYLEIEKSADKVHIKIQDNGIGIDPTELERVFEKFYTGANPLHHSSGKYAFEARGTGLGLAVARGYVEAHGGKIWAESTGVGKGTCLHIWLPVGNVCPLPEKDNKKLIMQNNS